MLFSDLLESFLPVALTRDVTRHWTATLPFDPSVKNRYTRAGVTTDVNRELPTFVIPAGIQSKRPQLTPTPIEMG